jgi:hypothetical protein
MLITSPIAQITVCAPNHIQKKKKEKLKKIQISGI